MAQKLSQLATEIWPFLLPKVGAMVQGSANAAGSSSGATLGLHDLSGSLHRGLLADAQAPQFLLTNGARNLTGNLAVDAGITIDGVDLSAHAADPDAHHATATPGSGISIAGQQISLIEPGTLTVSSGNAAAGNHTHAITSSANPGQAASLLASGSNGELTLYNGFFTQGAQSAATFASGFAGSGWRADYGITTASRASIETDDLTVRGRMRVYELLIQQIRASNGSLFVSSSSKIVAVTNNVNPAWTVNGSQLTFNGSNATLTFTHCVIATAAAGDTSRELYHGFLYGDIIRAQQVQWNGTGFAGVMQSNLEVTSVSSLYNYGAAFVSGDAPAVGYDFVRLGSTSDASRRGSIYLTSDDSAAPFIDIVDNVQYFSDWNSAGVARVRVGKLTGISDSAFGGALAGYGLYGNNVYLKGQIVVTGGSLGGLAAADVNSNTTTIDGGRITANSITASQIAANTITAGKLSVTTLSAIAANMGTLTAGSIVIGSSNKLWLNDSADGALNIGGTTKASAPFQVTAAGALTATSATITGLLKTTGGGVASGNWYVGYDSNYSGAMFIGTGGGARLWSDGLSLVQASIDTSTTNINIPTRSSAIRWFPDISVDYSHDNSKDYSGIIGYRDVNSGNRVVDNIWTSFVGSVHTTGLEKYAARVMLQAGNHDGATYRDARLEVIKDPGANSIGSIACNATYTFINGMLRIEPKTAAALIQSDIHIYVSPNGKLVFASYDGSTTRFKYIEMYDNSTTFTYTTTAPA